MGFRGSAPSAHLRACAWLLAACLPTAAHAIAPHVRLADLHRSEWTRFQGAPTDASTLVTTSDGMLWLLGSGGIFRFDGVRFHPFVPLGAEPVRGASIIGAAADRHGGLWIGQSDGELLHIDGRTLVRHAPVKGLHTGTLTDLAIDDDDNIWVVSKAGLSMFDGTAWRGFGNADGLPAEQVDDVEIAADGRAWVLTATGLYAGDDGNTRFAQVDTVPPATHMTGLMLTAAGEVWRWQLTGDDGLCRLVPRDARACWTVHAPIDPKLDAHGALWWAGDDGLYRVRDPAALDSERGALVRDAEKVDAHGEQFVFGIDGSVWTVEPIGLVRLRQTPIRHVPTPSGALAPANDGSVWLGSFTRGLMRIGVPPPGTALQQGNDDTLWTDAAVAASADLADMMTFTPRTEPPPPGTPVVLARYPDANARSTVRLDPMPGGGVRVGTLSPLQLVEHDGTSARQIALPALDRGILPRGSGIDAHGDLWLAVARNAVPFFRLRNGVWQPYGGVPDVDRNAINGFKVDGDTVWIAIGKDSIGRVADGAWTRFGPEQGVDMGHAIAPLVHGGQVWVAGALGLQGFVDERFVSIIGHDGDRFIGSTGMLQLDNGDLWLNGVAGLSRIERREWQQALRDPAHRVAYTRIDHHDGNMAGAMQGAPLPALVQGSDGMLWAATDGAMLQLDPAAVRAALPPPTVQLLSLAVDGNARAFADGVELPVGSTRIGLAFAAPPGDAPERVRMRYRLQAQGDWIDAGERRDVLYEALPPGDHVFEVMASDREGRWSETPTQLRFVLPPRFHQTIWFQALLGLAALALLACIYAVRMRQVAERTRRETTTRLHERMRIARDLHDTLLQSVQALHMQVQAIAARVPEDDPMRTRIDTVLDRAGDSIREGRDRIGALRDPLAGTSDLPQTLQRSAERLAHDAGMACDIVVQSTPLPLHRHVYDELLQIGREALLNALQHAGATRVQVRIAQTADGVSFSVSDDGGGIPGEVLERGGREAHFGLRGMRERAALVGAELHVRNGDDSGAEVTLRMAAARAYSVPPRPRGWLARLWRGRFTDTSTTS